VFVAFQFTSLSHELISCRLWFSSGNAVGPEKCSRSELTHHHDDPKIPVKVRYGKMLQNVRSTMEARNIAPTKLNSSHRGRKIESDESNLDGRARDPGKQAVFAS